MNSNDTIETTKIKKTADDLYIFIGVNINDVVAFASG